MWEEPNSSQLLSSTEYLVPIKVYFDVLKQSVSLLLRDEEVGMHVFAERKLSNKHINLYFETVVLFWEKC